MKLFAKKIGMTEVAQNYVLSSVTVLDISENVIAKISEGKLLLGWGKKKHPTKAQLGSYKELGFVPTQSMEVVVPDVSVYTVGSAVALEVPVKIQATGISKGKGFAGVVKRYHFKGGPHTHGASDRERAPGAIGPGTTPGRVLKGTRMAGHMGVEQVTVKNLEVIKQTNVDGKVYFLVKGSVPGARGSIIQLAW